MRESVMYKVYNSGNTILELFPFVNFSCPEDNSCSADGIVMKLHPWTEYDKGRHYA